MQFKEFNEVNLFNEFSLKQNFLPDLAASSNRGQTTFEIIIFLV